LKQGFRKFFSPRHVPFSPNHAEAVMPRTIRSWCAGKTKAAIASSMAQSPPDWDPLFTKLFLKGQVVKKLGALFGRAKAGQTVATFPKSRIFEDSFWAVYVRDVVESWRLPTTYLHDQPLSRMFSWYSQFSRRGLQTANDYTAWDSGCDHVFALFDAWILEESGVPAEYIDRYLQAKFNTRSYLGPALPMQFSGDRWTWLFNTLRNAALTGASLNCKAGTPAMFSGDDSLVFGHFIYNRGFVPSDWLMTPKTERGFSLDFCGFTAGDTLYVSPHVLLARARIAIRDGKNDPSFWDSFDLAARYSHRRGPDSILATALSLSHSARQLYSLPPSKFPNMSV
jgi:hypothetical protein